MLRLKSARCTQGVRDHDSNSCSASLINQHPNCKKELHLTLKPLASIAGLMFIIWSTYWLWSVIDIHLRTRAAGMRTALPVHTVSKDGLRTFPANDHLMARTAAGASGAVPAKSHVDQLHHILADLVSLIQYVKHNAPSVENIAADQTYHRTRACIVTLHKRDNPCCSPVISNHACHGAVT